MQDIRDAMKQTNRIFEEAIASGDMDRLADVYTTDARLLPPGAPMVEGRAAIRQFWSVAIEAMGVKSCSLRTLHADAAADHVIEIGEVHIEMAGGHALAKYVVYWKPQDGRWKWHLDIWNQSA